MNLKVRILSNRGATPQWGMGGLFEIDGYKVKIKSPWLKWSIITGTILFSIIALFQNNHEENTYRSEISEGKVNVEAPQIITNTKMKSDGSMASDEGNKNHGAPKNRNQKSFKSNLTLGPQVIQPKNFLEIAPGTFIKAKLLTGASNGLVKAQILEAIFSENELLAPENSIILGEGISNEERLNIKFQKLVLSDGTKIKINAQGYDVSDQIIGLKGSRVGAKALKVAGGIGLGFLGGLSEGLQDTQNVNGMEIRQPSMRNAMLNGAATASIEESKDLLNSLKTEKTVIEVPAQTEFYLLTDEINHDLK